MPMSYAMNPGLENLEEKARAAVAALSRKRIRAIRRSFSDRLLFLNALEQDNRLSANGRVQLAFLKEAAKVCTTDDLLVQHLLLSWMLAEKAKHAGWLTPGMETSAAVVQSICLFGGLVLDVNR